MATTFLPVLVLRPTETGFRSTGIVIHSFGLGLMILTIAFLNRSFGIAPAHRGLVTSGPYRWMRHPLYAAEIVALTGYCLGYLSPGNGLAWLALVTGQLLRIRAEENLLAQDSDYQVYQARVRWRLVPGLW